MANKRKKSKKKMMSQVRDGVYFVGGWKQTHLKKDDTGLMVGTFQLNSSHITALGNKCFKFQYISYQETKTTLCARWNKTRWQTTWQPDKVKITYNEVWNFHMRHFPFFLIVFDVFYNVKRFKHSGLDKMINYWSLSLLIKSAYAWHFEI